MAAVLSHPRSLTNGTLHEDEDNNITMGSNDNNQLDHSQDPASNWINPIARYSAQIQQQGNNGVEWQKQSRASDRLNGEDSSCAHYKERVKQYVGDGVGRVTPDRVLDSLGTSVGQSTNSSEEGEGGLQLQMMDGQNGTDEHQSSRYAGRSSKSQPRMNGFANGHGQGQGQDVAQPFQELTQTGSISSSDETVPTLSTSTTDDTSASSPEAAKISHRPDGQQTTSSSRMLDGVTDNSLGDSTGSSTRRTTPPTATAAGPNPTMYLVGSALSTSSTSVLPSGTITGANRSPRATALSFSSSSNGSSSAGSPSRRRGLPNLAALHTNSSPAIPQVASIIPPTPPSTGSNLAASTSPTNTSFDAKSAYLSPDQMRKIIPGHTRSLSYTNGLSGPLASTSTSMSASTSGATLAPSSYPPRRSSLLANVSQPAVLLGSPSTDPALKKRSLSPRRGLSFRTSISQQQQQDSVVYDEPLSIEQQAEQQRQADELNSNIARQAEQIRQERLSKRIETQKAHDKALAALREDQQKALVGPVSPDPGATSPTASEFAGGALGGGKDRKGKERERDNSGSNRDTWESAQSQNQYNAASPSSPVSATSLAWASSPIAGEKAQLRAPDTGVGVLVDRQLMSGGAGGAGGTPSSGGKAGEPPEPDRVLVGNLIGEDHVNYVMMYNMLTGIRIGVSRCEAKVRRPLTDDDYTARHKFSFDIVGNELTPSAKYDFKFKDYAPWVFRELREYFHLDPADYLLSLTAKYILSELGSPGKSGSFFYFSRDYRFIIKTISHTEHKFLRKILKDYHRHVLDNPHTLISRFYGLHRVKLPHGRKIHFVIMNNLFPPHRDIHETYDLKGSSIGREYPEEQAAKNPRGTLKDLNWIHRKRDLDFGPTKRHLFEEQLQRDVELLKKLGIMDYSLLVGIHDMARGNSENLRDGMLTVFKPETAGGKLRRRPTQRGDFEDASALRRAVQRSDPKALGQDGLKLPDKDRSERRHFLFYQDEGGIRATDEQDQNENTIYYLGVIDILTPYNWYKKIEHAWRSMQYDGHRISAVPPAEYGDRFLGFLYSIIRGGDVSKRPKME